MSEEIHDQVSAFMDDELSTEECAFLVRRLERDPDARSRLVRYSLIGSMLRREMLLPDPDMLRRRVHEALNGAAPALKPAIAVKPRWQRRLTAPAFGVAVAASVALVSLFVVRTVNETSEVAATATARLAAPLANDSLSSYVVPQDPQQQSGSTVQAPIRLTNYLVHHGEYTSLLSRTSVHSTVIGALNVPVVDSPDNAPAASSTVSGQDAARGQR